jgi:hypothetical protein
MKKLLWLLGSLITSVMMGVGFIHPEEKAFTPGQYYVGRVEDADPDWRSLYLNQMGGGSGSGQMSDKSIKSLTGEETAFVPDSPSNFNWFWAVDRSKIVKTSKGNDIMVDSYGNPAAMSLVQNLATWDYKKITFKVPKDTKVIAPANAYLVPSSQNSDGAYPDTQATRGKYIQIIVKKDNVAYKVTYGDLLMWWSDMNKPDGPDDYKNGDKTQPVYNHTVAFSDKDMFDSGTVLGVAGNTGRTAAERKDDTNKDYAFVTISIEKSDIKDGIVTEVWYPINISDFFKTGG